MNADRDGSLGIAVGKRPRIDAANGNLPTGSTLGADLGAVIGMALGVAPEAAPFPHAVTPTRSISALETLLFPADGSQCPQEDANKHILGEIVRLASIQNAQAERSQHNANRVRDWQNGHNNEQSHAIMGLRTEIVALRVQMGAEIAQLKADLDAVNETRAREAKEVRIAIQKLRTEKANTDGMLCTFSTLVQDACNSVREHAAMHRAFLATCWSLWDYLNKLNPFLSYIQTPLPLP